MSMHTDIGTLILRSPDIRAGRPYVAGSGVSVRRIVGWYQLGLNAEEIADRVGHLTVGQVYAALAYYHANRDEIDIDLAAEDAAAQAPSTYRIPGRSMGSGLQMERATPE